MESNQWHIISTRPLTGSLIDEASAQHVLIDDSHSFIQTEPITDTTVHQQIQQLSQQNIIAAFTSMNAVEAVAAQCQQSPQWNIYSIGHATCQLVEQLFPNATIAGTAAYGGQLAQAIIKDKPSKVYFFCGDQRRDELPSLLKACNITVEEIIVYKTLETPVRIECAYDGVLFFSPSAVHSFFSVNQPILQAVYFAIGTTTAAAIQQHQIENVIIAEEPSKEGLAKQAIAYFRTQKSIQS